MGMGETTQCLQRHGGTLQQQTVFRCLNPPGLLQILQYAMLGQETLAIVSAFVIFLIPSIT